MGITTMSSVYDGRQCCGFVLHHVDERTYEAIDLQNKSCGIFATHREAAAALPSISSTEETNPAINEGVSSHG
jgi:hypothetical protein